MPKGTRKTRAAELLRRLERGPSVSVFGSEQLDTPDKIVEWFNEHYRLWSQSWIINEVVDLIPELREARKEKQCQSQES